MVTVGWFLLVCLTFIWKKVEFEINVSIWPRKFVTQPVIEHNKQSYRQDIIYAVRCLWDSSLKSGHLKEPPVNLSGRRQ